MGYINPLMALPAARRLMELVPQHSEVARAMVDLLTEMRHDANERAETSWRRKKAPMAAYARACATYFRHVAHVLKQGLVRADAARAVRKVLARAVAAARKAARPPAVAEWPAEWHAEGYRNALVRAAASLRHLAAHPSSSLVDQPHGAADLLRTAQDLDITAELLLRPRAAARADAANLPERARA